MKPRTMSQLLLALAAIVMLPVFVSPLWSIRLVAPQYSEGLGMHIYVNDIRGHERHDLQNINILNHYIGMQPIDPDEVPELDIMPWILGGLILTGLVVALIGSPWLMIGWIGLVLVAGIAGMVDFYLWNIDYGHNLSPDAPIRIPDMTYSPPIIGTEQILNIRASSYPHLGSLWLGISMILAGMAVFFGFRGRKEGDGPRGTDDPSEGLTAGNRRTVGKAAGVASAFLVLIAACGSPDAGERDPGHLDAVATEDRMVYGDSEDPFCGGQVESVRWGGEIRTVGGEALRFRSVECMAAFLLDERIDERQIAELRVVDFPHGWRLIDVAEATFLQTPNLSSPDRLNVLAIQDAQMIRNLHDAYTGRLMEWDEVLRFVSSEWNLGSAGNAASARTGADS